MANWVNNNLRVYGDPDDLAKFRHSLGTHTVPLNYEQLAEIIPMSWHRRDPEQTCDVSELSGEDGRSELEYIFQTAWGTREKMFTDLAKLHPQLELEISMLRKAPHLSVRSLSPFSHKFFVKQ